MQGQLEAADPTHPGFLYQRTEVTESNTQTVPDEASLDNKEDVLTNISVIYCVADNEQTSSTYIVTVHNII